MRSLFASIGNLFRPASNYQLAGWLFLRTLALIYLAAFASLSTQIAGLAGPEGILPFQNYLNEARQLLGHEAWLRVPTLFWFNSSDLALQAACYAGMVLAVSLLFGRAEKTSLFLLFVLYLSLYRAGQIFTNFQWDTLLLEAGLLALFLQGRPTVLVIFLYHWLLFRLRFMSGAFKLISGDPSWADFSALNHYFATQPLPHAGAWFANQLPDWLLRTGVGFTFFTELLVPFFIFLPRPFRLLAVAITLFMQGLILATSNHNFFNLLTIALCILLLDDRLLSKLIPSRLQERIQSPPASLGRIRPALLALTGSGILLASGSGFYALASGNSLPPPLAEIRRSVQAFGVGAVYHVFPTVQTERHELVIQGSEDGERWQAYQFRYKPQALDHRPPFIVPHQPRLDWLLWFAPTQHPLHMQWFGQLMERLHQASPEVLSLFEIAPFGDRPPPYLRVLVYRYHFTTAEERRRSRHWWKREYLGLFPVVPPRHP